MAAVNEEPLDRVFPTVHGWVFEMATGYLRELDLKE